MPQQTQRNSQSMENVHQQRKRSTEDGPWARRRTEQRLAIIEILESSEQPLSARDIFQVLNRDRERPLASLPTVYRAIKEMHLQGRLSRVFDGPSRESVYSVRADDADDLQVRVRCRHCDSEWNIPDERVARELMRFASELAAGSPTDHVEVLLTCKRCLRSLGPRHSDPVK